MQGDVIIVENHHRSAAGTIVDHLEPKVKALSRPYAISVAGESGSGKSETAEALKEAFESRGMQSVILQQDDYFVLPPKSNDARRRRNIDWVGPGEVRLGLLDAHIRAAVAGETSISKPLIIYDEDRVSEETVSLEGVSVVIAEGTYTTALSSVDCRVFIRRDFHDTFEARKRRGREKFDPFLEKVLEIEHAAIVAQGQSADISIERDFDVGFR